MNWEFNLEWIPEALTQGSITRFKKYVKVKSVVSWCTFILNLARKIYHYTSKRDWKESQTIGKTTSKGIKINDNATLWSNFLFFIIIFLKLLG